LHKRRDWCCGTPLSEPHTPGCSFEPREDNAVNYDGKFVVGDSVDFLNRIYAAGGKGFVDAMKAGPDALTWMGWALPAILEVLAGHRFSRANHSSIGANDHCLCGFRPFDQLDWNTHVGPIIADRIGCDPKRAAAALASYTPKP
jgi:hypothetical protein